MHLYEFGQEAILLVGLCGASVYGLYYTKYFPSRRYTMFCGWPKCERGGKTTLALQSMRLAAFIPGAGWKYRRKNSVCTMKESGYLLELNRASLLGVSPSMVYPAGVDNHWRLSLMEPWWWLVCVKCNWKVTKSMSSMKVPCWILA